MPAATAILVASAAAALAAAFLLRRRAPAWITATVLAAAGAGISWAGLRVLGGEPVEYAVLTPMMALFVPIHVRIVLGPFGPR